MPCDPLPAETLTWVQCLPPSVEWATRTSGRLNPAAPRVAKYTFPSSSNAVAAPEGSGHDLVWNNVFADEDAFWLYAGHPYHANLVNDLLAPDAPASNVTFARENT